MRRLCGLLASLICKKMAVWLNGLNGSRECTVNGKYRHKNGHFRLVLGLGFLRNMSLGVWQAERVQFIF